MPLTRSLAAAAALAAVAAAGLVVVGVGFGNATLLLPHLPPRSGMDRFLLIAWPAACLLEAVLASEGYRWSAGMSWAVGGAARSVAAIGLGMLLLSGSVHLRAEGSGLTLVAWAVALGAAWHVIAWNGERVLAAVAVVPAILATGGLILAGGWIRGGLLALPIAGAVSTAVILFPPPLRQMAAGCGGAGLVGLVALGHFFGRLSVLQAACVVAAAVAAAVIPAYLGSGRSDVRPPCLPHWPRRS